MGSSAYQREQRIERLLGTPRPVRSEPTAREVFALVPSSLVRQLDTLDDRIQSGGCTLLGLTTTSNGGQSK